jgi:hypothetical protein
MHRPSDLGINWKESDLLRVLNVPLLTVVNKAQYKPLPDRIALDTIIGKDDHQRCAAWGRRRPQPSHPAGVQGVGG